MDNKEKKNLKDEDFVILEDVKKEVESTNETNDDDYQIQEDKETADVDLDWVKDFYKHIKENKRKGFERTGDFSCMMQLFKDEDGREFFDGGSDYSMTYGSVTVSTSEEWRYYTTQFDADGNEYMCDEVTYKSFMEYLHSILKSDCFPEDFDLHETFKLLKTDWRENYGIEDEEEIYPTIMFTDVTDCFNNDVDVIVDILIDDKYVVENTSISKLEAICKQLNDMEQQRKDDDTIVLK